MNANGVAHFVSSYLRPFTARFLLPKTDLDDGKRHATRILGPDNARGLEEKMWREVITKHTDDATFNEPSSASEVDLAGAALGVPFPNSLRSALLESNGIDGEYALGLLWPVSRIVADNQSFRSNADFRELYMPFDNLLFFSDAGNGDQFAFVVLDGEVRRNDIFIWNHEDDSRTWGAPTLETFYEWWLSGQLSI